jgi:hypothetical protein
MRGDTRAPRLASWVRQAPHHSPCHLPNISRNDLDSYGLGRRLLVSIPANDRRRNQDAFANELGPVSHRELEHDFIAASLRLDVLPNLIERKVPELDRVRIRLNDEIPENHVGNRICDV